MIDDCWNKIGVYGDSSCPKLTEHVHCRNCPVYSNAAMELLDVALPDGYLSQWTRHVAQECFSSEPDTDSVVVFRVGVDYMALPTTVFKEIADIRVVHSIPRRRGGLVLGLVNVRGQLVVTVSLRRILGLGKSDTLPNGAEAARERLLVLESVGNRVVCPVDEVYGIHRFHRRDVAVAPATISKATAAYTTAVLPWQKKSVALLDHELLFHTFERSLASTAI